LNFNNKQFQGLNSRAHEERNYEETLLVSYTTPDCPLNAPQEVIDWADANPGIEVWYAQDTHTPDQVGDWTVKVTFYRATGCAHEHIKFRATSFFVIDEVPLRTIVTLFILLGFLSIMAIKKKSKAV
jgi:hypothetical protein